MKSHLNTITTRFNEELQQQINGTLPQGHIYKLGMPSQALLSNLDNHPIEMAASTLEIKSSREYKSNHPFDLKDIANLPKALAHPLAVFESETNPGRTVVLTELKDKNGGFFVAVIDVMKKNRINIINTIRSLYPKGSNARIAKWFLGESHRDIGRNLLKWVDKEKTLNWLSGNATDVRSAGLSVKSTAKIIQNFENTKSF